MNDHVPSGWCYGQYPYLYESETDTWYWISSDPSVWCKGPMPDGPWLPAWQHAPFVSGWSWWDWPYAWASSPEAWYYMQEGDTSVRNMFSGEWFRFGRPSLDNIVWPIRASFLMDNGGNRLMNDLSMGASRTRWQTNINRAKACGANCMWYYTSNKGDGSPVPTSIYQNGLLSGPLDEGAIAEMKWRLSETRKQDMGVMLWLFADDSSVISNQPWANVDQYVRTVVSRFGAYTNCGYCIGLEADEHMNQERVLALSTLLNTLTSKLIWIHQVPGHTGWNKIAGIDGMIYQMSFGGTPSSAASQTLAVMPGVRPDKFIFGEYHLSSESSQARAMGQAILSAGADGVGNGS